MKYHRKGLPTFDDDGMTVDQNIRIPGGSKIEIEAGHPARQIRLQYSSGDGQGWWVDESALGHVIAELLYIRQDIEDQRRQPAVDVEIEDL